jgi:DNA invertase Pin-like site-specific DNA recombinase
VEGSETFGCGREYRFAECHYRGAEGVFEKEGGNKEMKVIGYVRVSTEEQALSGVSLDAQEQRIRAYCHAKDWTLTEVVRDEGLSAKNLKRPGLQCILERVPRRNGKRGFDSIVVVKLDRFTRSVGDLAYLNKLFETNKVSFVSIQESVDTSTASGKLFHNIIASLSEWERGVISERTRDALHHKRSKGERAGEVPFGYQLSGDGKTLRPIQQEQEVLNTIRSLRNSSLSYWKIADHLNGHGIISKKGGKWYPESVQSVLLHASL